MKKTLAALSIVILFSCVSYAVVSGPPAGNPILNSHQYQRNSEMNIDTATIRTSSITTFSNIPNFPFGVKINTATYTSYGTPGATRYFLYTLTSGMDCSGRTNGGKVTSTGSDLFCADDISGGGGGGASTLGVYQDGVQKSSPTAQLNFLSAGGLTVTVTAASTATISLNGNSTNYIRNNNALQSGSTAYPQFLYVGSSASIVGVVTASSAIVSGLNPNQFVLTDSNKMLWTKAKISLSTEVTGVLDSPNLTPNATYYIRNNDAYQTGARFIVSSGTFKNELSISSNTVSLRIFNMRDVLSNDGTVISQEGPSGEIFLGRFDRATESNYGLTISSNYNSNIMAWGDWSYINNLGAGSEYVGTVFAIDKLNNHIHMASKNANHGGYIGSWAPPFGSIATVMKSETDTGKNILDLSEEWTDGFDYYYRNWQTFNTDKVNFLTPLELGNQSDLKLMDSDSSNYVSFVSSESIAYNQKYVLPSSTGSIDDVLAIGNTRPDGRTETKWRTVTGGGGGGGTGISGPTAYGSLYTSSGAVNQTGIISTVKLSFFSNAGISTFTVSSAASDSITISTTGIFNAYATFTSSDNSGSANLRYYFCVNGTPSNYSASFNPINYHIPAALSGILSLSVGDVVTLCGNSEDLTPIGISITDAQLIVSASGGIGGTTTIIGGGGSSSFGIFKDGVQISSPSAQINFSGNYWDITLGGTSTGTVKLIGGNTNYIQVSNTLQSGATAYPSFIIVGSSMTVLGSGGVTVNNLTASQFVKTDANKRLSSQAQISLATDVTGTLSATNFVSTAAYITSTQTFSGTNVFTSTTNTFSGDGSGLLRISSLTATGVPPGSYTNANITVNAEGRVTSASNGSAGSGGGGSVGAPAYGSLYSSSNVYVQTGITTSPTKLTIFSSAGISTFTVSNASTDEITISTTGVFNVYSQFSSSDVLNPIRFYICVNNATTTFSFKNGLPVTIGGIYSFNVGDKVSLCAISDIPAGTGFSITDAQLIVSAVGGAGGTTGSGSGSSVYFASSTAGFPYGFSASTGVFSSTVTASAIGVNATPTYALTVSTIGAGTLAAPTDIFLWGGSTAGNPELYIRGRENVGGGMQTGSISIESSSNGSGDSKFLIEAFNPGGHSNNVRIKVPNDGLSHAGVNFHGSGPSAVVWKQDAVDGDGFLGVRSSAMQENSAPSLDEEGIFIQEGRNTEIRNYADNIYFLPDGGTMALRSTATTLISPTSGVGIEWAYDTDDNRQGATGLGSMTAYDRTGAAYKSLRVNGYDFGIYASGIQKMLVDSNAVYIGSGTSATPLRFMEPSGSGVNYTGFIAQAQAANVTYTLPPDDGDPGEQLQTDGSGNLTWEASGGAGGGGGSSSLGVFQNGSQISSPTAQINFIGPPFSISLGGSSTATVRLDGSSVTLGGVLTAGSNITITPGTGITTIAATGGSGSSIYPATSTVVFPFGVSSTTGVFTSTVSVGQKLGIQNTTPAYAIEIGNLSAGGDVTYSAATGAIVNTNSTQVTKFIGENTSADSSSSGSFIGLSQNDGTAVNSGDRLGGFSFSGYDGVDRVRVGAAILAYANGTYSATAAPSKLDFEVASSASATRSVKLSVNESSIDILSGTSAQQLRLYEPSGSGTNYSGFKSQAQAGDVIYTLPAADGSSNYVLSTNGSGTLSWVAQSGSGGGVTVYPATSTIIANAGGIQASTGVFTSTISASAIVIGSGTAASPSLQFSPDIFTHKSGFYEVLSPHPSIGLTVDDVQDVAYFGSTSVGFKGPTTITDYADPNNTILNLNGGSVNTYISLRNNSSLPAVLVGSVKNAGEDQYFSFAGSANGLTVSSEAAKLNTTTTSNRFGYLGLFISTPNARLHVNGDAIIESTFTVTKSTIVLNGTTYYWNAGAGSNGQFLKTDGAAKPTLTWGTASGSSGFNYTFPASQANLPGTNAPYISNSTNAASAGVFFDETSTQTVTWSTMLNNYNSGTLYADIIYTSSATSGTMNWGVYIECKTPSVDTLDYDTNSFSTVNSTSVTVGATSGMAMKATATLTNQDSCANGDTVRIKLERRAQDTDTAVGKGRVRFLRLYE